MYKFLALNPQIFYDHFGYYGTEDEMDEALTWDDDFRAEVMEGYVHAGYANEAKLTYQ